jgi:hypothetical protein
VVLGALLGGPGWVAVGSCPEQPEPVTIREADGNCVILALGKGSFAFYAWRSGAQRRRDRPAGQQWQLHRAASLHFNVMNRPSALAAEGLPYVFDRFRIAGRIPPLDDALRATVNAGQPVPFEPTGAGPHRRKLPLGRDVVDFRPN